MVLLQRGAPSRRPACSRTSPLSKLGPLGLRIRQASVWPPCLARPARAGPLAGWSEDVRYARTAASRGYPQGTRGGSHCLTVSTLDDVRQHLAITLAFLFMGRQDIYSHLSISAWTTRTFGSGRRKSNAQRKHHAHAQRRIVRIPVNPPPSHGIPSAIPRQIVVLARRYMRMRLASKGVSAVFFQLPQEKPPTTASMSRWVEQTLRRYKYRYDISISAPTGFAYLGHSIRSGASSAAGSGGHQGPKS